MLSVDSKNLAGAKILVLGGSGFIGATLLPRLALKGCEIWVLNRGSRKIAGVRQLVADRKDRAQVRAALDQVQGKLDAVIDTSSYDAASTEIAWHALLSPLLPRSESQGAGRVGRWVHISSSAVYQEISATLARESDPIGGAEVWGDYGRNKSAIDSFLFERSGQIPVVLFRPPYLYGPHNDLDRETFVWARLLQKRPVLIPGQGQTGIQFLYVEDLADAIETALTVKLAPLTCAYNVAARQILTLKEYVRALADCAGVRDSGIVDPSRTSAYAARQYFPFRDYPCALCVDKIERDWGWQARTTFEQGHQKTLAGLDVQALARKPLTTDIEDKIMRCVPG